MLSKEYLELEKIFAPDVLWELLPHEIPGQVIKKNEDGSGEIRPRINIHYPDGSPMKSLYCPRLDYRVEKDWVMFQLVDATEQMKKKEKQPYLKVAVILRSIKLTDIKKEEYFTDVNRVAQLSKELQTLRDELKNKRQEIEAEVEHLVEQRTAKRQKELDDREKAIVYKEESLNREIEETAAEWETKLNQKEKELAEKAQEIAQLREEMAGIETRMAAKKNKALEAREIELHERFQALIQEIDFLKTERERLSRESQELNKALRQVLNRRIGQEQAFSSIPATVWKDQEAVKPFEPQPVPIDLPDVLARAFTENQYLLPLPIIRKFLLSTLTACISGQFVVLSGPTGVGKTSMVSNFSSALGAGCGIVPVRPAWLEPTELLGFYNPQQKRYQPSPFMDRFLEARDYSEANRLYFLTLDEMNLSRIENYAADFLSRLEKARAGEERVSINLYSQEIEEMLWKEVTKEMGRKGADVSMLIRHLSKYPANLSIPQGLILFGTINLDETTYPLSPKFLDRAFILNIPHQPLQGNLEQFGKIGLPPNEPIYELSLQTLRTLVDREDLPEQVKEIWQEFLTWQEDFLTPMGVRPSFRFASLFSLYMRLAANLGFDQYYEAAGSFFQAKLLPRISFSRSEVAIGSQNDTRKFAYLQNWSDEVNKNPYGQSGFANDLQEMVNKFNAANNSDFVRYLE